MNEDSEGRCRPSIPGLRRAVPSLRFIFWGALINVVDLRINGIDLLNDILGMVLVSIGAWRLAGLRVEATYRKGTLFAAVVALLSLLAAILEHGRATPATRAYGEAVGLLEIAAIGVFGWMMVRLCRAAELPDVAADWTVTLKWFLWVYVGLVGLFRAAAALWLMAGRPRLPLPSIHVSAWVVGLLLLLGLLLVPWIRMFGSTSRLAKALQLKAWSRTIRERRLRPSSPGRTGGGP